MAKTLSDIQTKLAYRLNESSVPNNTNEINKRKAHINDAYMNILSEQYWWFTEASATFSVNGNQEYYSSSDGVPADVRAIMELRVDGQLYTQVQQEKAISAFNTPYSNAVQSYFIFGGNLYFIPQLQKTSTIKIKYYRSPSELSNDSDIILIPDIYVNAVVAFAYARTIAREGEPGSSESGFDEYREILSKMLQEQNRYSFSFKGASNELEVEFP